MTGALTPIQRQAIPSALIDQPHWVAWRLEDRNGKQTKVPVNPHTGGFAKTNDCHTWSTFDDACERAATDHLAGVGFVFSGDDGLVGIDLDRVLNFETGDILPWARHVVEALNSYTEVSPSQRGLHIFVRAALPAGGCRKGQIEMYSSGRFFTVTGLPYPGTPADILPRQTELDALHHHIFSSGPQANGANGHPRVGASEQLSDHELIQRASSAKNGAKFSRLWGGDWQAEGYDSQSEADQALCNILAFWTDKDRARIDQLFRQSALFRPKWDQSHYQDGRTYGHETITQSLLGISESYGPGSDRNRSIVGLKAGASSLHNGAPAPDTRPTLKAQTGDLRLITQQSWDAVQQANRPPRLFLFGGLPSRLEFPPYERVMIRELSVDRLRHEAARAARWVEWKKDKEQNAKPPLDVIHDMLACESIPLPLLSRVVETPVFGQSGWLLSIPGYHEVDGVYYAPGDVVVPSVPSTPTTSDIAAARDLLLDEFLGDFPFVNTSGRAQALAALLLPFVRDLIDGPTPLHLIEKPTPRTGGTLLASMLALPAVGESVTHVTEAHDTDEWRKMITSLLRSGPLVVCVDNIRRRLEAASFASALTARHWTDRLLGHSEKVTLPVRCTWLATGNNPVMTDEILGRTVFIRLDAGVDRPQDRTGFRHALPSWAIEHRRELIHAALVLCQAWIAAGRPPGTRSKGGFEAWSRVLGGILSQSHIEGFLTEPEPQFADPENLAWTQFIDLWWRDYREKSMGVSGLLPLVASTSQHRDPIDLGLPDGTLKSQQIALGKRLIERRDRQFTLEGDIKVHLVGAGVKQGAQLWQLRRVGQEPSKG